MDHLSLNSKIAVLRGGPSEEYDLSLKTGADVLTVLQSLGYKTVDVMITKKGEWLVSGIVKEPQSILEAVDTVFVGLHGAYGEDGAIQRILNRHAVAYTGSGAMASALAFNKMLTKEFLKNSTVKMPKHLRVSRESKQNLGRIANTIGLLFGPSFVIKPIFSGSSIGVDYAFSLSELIAILDSALDIYAEVLVEEYIEGADVTCAYLGDFGGIKD